MSTKKTVVISDIHMGTNVSTNWYQKDIHEPYIATILNWVISNKAEIDELIILGDLFDFWTYAPDEPPPTAAQIVDANPNILGELEDGKPGLLSQVLSALEGRVSYLRGNHDINTTQDDLNKIKNPNYSIKLQPDVYVKGGVVYTHGHRFTLFNSPDLTEQRLPVGHYVTRAIAFQIKQGGGHASNESGFGAPKMGYGALENILPAFPTNVLDVPGFLKNLSGLVSLSVTSELLTAIQGTTKIPWDSDIKIEGGATTTLRKVKDAYANVFSDWVKLYKAGEGDLQDLRGLMFAYKATNADMDGDYLGWFAQQLAFEHQADLVVMGHTHIPKLGLEGDITNYLNNGFKCVPIPDMGPNKITFSIITSEGGKYVSSEIRAITKQGDQYPISNDDPKPAPALGGAAEDYSCYITVENKSNEKYTLDPNSIKANHGYFTVNPPSEIPANQTVRFWIQDFPGPEGSDGAATYRGQNSGRNIQLTFKCPFGKISAPRVLGHGGQCELNCNDCGGTDEFYTKSDNVNSHEGSKNSITQKDNPFFVRFVIN